MDLPVEPFAPDECSRCGGGNSPQARFCQHCGTPLDVDDPAGWYEREDTRGSFEEDGYGEQGGAAAIVSAVVCELTASPVADIGPTPWGAADELAEVSSQILDEVREILRRSGGIVEDLPGGIATLTAVFGPEPADGDGPIRAIRAAADVREALAGEASADVGSTGETPEGPTSAAIRLRAGVGTAEIVGDGPDAEDLWRQRVIDLATRLQRMADAGEVIVAEGIYRRIGGVAELQPVDPHARIDGDGPTGPLRLLEVGPEPGTVSLGSAPLLGRDEERGRIRAAFERSAADRLPAIVRISGDHGVGKTRLAEGCLGDLSAEGSAVAVSVRYGPASELGGQAALAGLLEAVAGIAPSSGADHVRGQVERVLDGSPEAGRVAERLLPALGVPGDAEPDGTAWALGRFLEAAARERPLAILVDDADRTGPWFPRLLRSAVRTSRGPILLLVTDSSPEEQGALDREPIEHLRLGPLGREAMESLVASLLLDPDPAPAVRDRLLAASQGSALHLEQLAAALADRGSLRFERRRWVPAETFESPDQDLTTLLAARLGDLGLRERAVIGLLAVAGNETPWELIEELVRDADEPSVREVLASLVSRRYLRIQAEEVYAFRHELVRTVARATVPPEIEAEAHERCARWLEERCGDRPHRHAPAIASHLEAEARLGREVGWTGGDPGRRAAGLLTSSADLLSALGDEEGSLGSLRRASDLLEPDDPTRAEILLRLAAGLVTEGRHAAADPLLTQAARVARDGGDTAVETRARLLRALLPDGARRHERMETIWEAAEQTERACLEAEDDAGLSAAWSARAVVHRRWGHWAAAANDAERAAEHAARAELDREETEALRALALAVEDGPAPMDESVDRCREVLARARGRRLLLQEAEGVLAVLLARGGSFDEAAEHISVARSAVEGSGEGTELARVLHRAARVEALAGHPESAEELLWQALDAAVRGGNDGLKAAIGSTLANVMLDLGRAEEAQPLLAEVARTVAHDDVVTQVAWRSASARALAASGRTGEARELARQAVRLAEQTDLMDLRAGALLALAEVLRAEGRPNEAVPFARRALRALERRGAAAPAERARSLLESLGRPAGSPVPSHDDAPEPQEHASSPETTDPTEPEPDPASDVAGEAESRWWSFGRT